jgi:hypothetical protein
MNYLDTSKRIRNEIETKNRLSGSFKKSSILDESNSFLSLPYERNELNERTALKLEEIVCRYRDRGWIQIYSGYLNRSVYFVKNKSTRVPDPSIPRYTKQETEALRGLTLDELKTLHEVKVIFKGEIHVQ